MALWNTQALLLYWSLKINHYTALHSSLLLFRNDTPKNLKSLKNRRGTYRQHAVLKSLEIKKYCFYFAMVLNSKHIMTSEVAVPNQRQNLMNYRETTVLCTFWLLLNEVKRAEDAGPHSRLNVLKLWFTNKG